MHFANSPSRNFFAARTVSLITAGVIDQLRFSSAIIYCYVNDREEQEFICWPAVARRVHLSLEEMRMRNQRQKKVITDKNNLWIQDNSDELLPMEAGVDKSKEAM